MLNDYERERLGYVDRLLKQAAQEIYNDATESREEYRKTLLLRMYSSSDFDRTFAAFIVDVFDQDATFFDHGSKPNDSDHPLV